MINHNQTANHINDLAKTLKNLPKQEFCLVTVNMHNAIGQLLKVRFA